ncbi:MAG: carboxymuconolactone decarboxylase family protein, partial [Gammaproteobacteria bacterium]
LDMHSKDARAAGETEQRLYALNAWRETPFYTERERAALAWTEALTRIRKGVPDELYAEVHKYFSDKEIVDLSFCIIAINGWNRLAIPFRAKVGDYQPGAYRKPAWPVAQIRRSGPRSQRGSAPTA